ncbi:Xaa-Pro aminopeptidase [Haloplanus vescus]|uniref:Xaa-Pro aminopeptidase n=1 Tax=Haloplanus vescus TaxID=555874 RepID=A0A1H3W3L2_9EURY|nr:Xaa-Pro peptidase family protein [Haloplanus vescus]SDZ81677.1 Xaa-Pro aminopeptidase [Haloplanus vescus]
MTPFERRTRRAQERLRAADADALVCAPGRDCQYLADVESEQSDRLQLLVVPAEDDPTFVVPALDAGPIRAATWVDDVRTWDDDDGPGTALDPLLSSLDPSRLLVSERMWARFVLDLQERCPEASLGLAGDVLDPLRMRKDETEREALRAAAEVADAAMRDVRALGDEAVGQTEADLAAFVAERLDAHGGEETAFDTIVASGPNGADPHHASGDREIRAGDSVVFDFGTRVDGYVSDQTRTVVFDGDPDPEFETVHDVVREAQAAGVAAVEPGVTTDAVDRAAREVIDAAGYGEAFVHRTGHGVGLDVHEAPSVVAGDGTTLEPGMAFSVEPGVYLPDRFGVRIEDVVLVTEDGAERLNRTDRGWRC